jgi:hypothetical protein
MAKINVLAGDVQGGSWAIDRGFLGGSLRMRKSLGMETVVLKGNLEKVEIQTEENVKKLGGTAGWGLAGMVALGPLGAVGGMLIGGRGKEILFSALLKDGRKFLATTDAKTFKMLAASAF